MNDLVMIIKRTVVPNFLNIRTSIKAYDRDALCCGAPCWRWAYHALHSADKWFINPNVYEEPAFHEEGMDNPDNPTSVVLSDEQKSVVLNARQPAQRAADGSNLTLIEAPVSVKRIKTLDEYKAFKTQARGSYPTADFAKEEVVVLESVSNLPDKVFEIVDIAPEGGNLKVRYRVNVFGLDKKINTHSAQKIDKSSLPIILEQVL